MTSSESPNGRIGLIRHAGIDERVLAIRLGTLVDSFAIVSDRFWILVDTLVSPQAAHEAVTLLQRECSDLTARCLIVVNTHGDWDHAWGNSLFDGRDPLLSAPIIGHAARRMKYDRAEAEAHLVEARTREPGTYDDVELVLPTVEITSSLSIDGGDLGIELLPTPGHTPDHLAVWIPKLKLLIAGDAAELPMPYVGQYSDLPQLRRSLQLMRGLQPDKVLYCHGGDLTDAELINHNIWYFDEAERRTRQALEAGHDYRDLSATDLEWPLSSVLPQRITEEDIDTGFYERSHRLAISAMASWVATKSPRP